MQINQSPGRWAVSTAGTEQTHVWYECGVCLTFLRLFRPGIKDLLDRGETHVMTLEELESFWEEWEQEGHKNA